jgi:cell division control protein 45
VVDSHRPLDLDNAAPDNASVLLLRDAREQVPGTGAEAFPPATSDGSDSEDEEEEEGGGSDRENEGASCRARAREGWLSFALARRFSRAPLFVCACACADAPVVRLAFPLPRRSVRAGERRVRQRTEAGVARATKARPSHTTRLSRHFHNPPCTHHLTRAFLPPQRAAARRARAEYYARGSFYGRPAACLLYDVAHALRRDSLDHHAPLWHAVVSLTDQYVHVRCSADAYTAGVFELASRVADAPGADAPRTASLEDGSTVAAFAQRRIGYGQEFRFMLHRHWSLYDAMLHAPYIAARLQTWTEPGRAALDRLLAEMGLPLAQCRQKFSHMAPAHLRALRTRLEAMAPAYGLSDIAFWSFTKQHGYKMDVCAADVVYGVTALLETGGGSGGSGAGGGGEGGEGGGGGNGGGGGAGAGAGAVAAGAAQVSGFQRAVEALSESHWETLKAGIDAAQRLQRVVLRTGGLALLGKCVVDVGPFRFVNLCAGAAASGAASGGDAALLRQPMALLRLALFIQDAVHVRRPRKHKPLVLAAPAPASASGDAAAASQDGNPAAGSGADMVLVVGVTGAPRAGDARGNGFGTSFHVAASAVRAPFAHDAFEAAVITLGASHLEAFLEQLQHEEIERNAL